MRVALVLALGAAVCSTGTLLAAQSQTYEVGAPPAKSPQAPAAQKQTQAAAPQQQLGFGSNIENARLARAAELALQHGDKAQALDYARRAAQASPGNAQLWFLVGYAARLNGRPGESVEAYGKGLKLQPSSIEGQSGLAQTYATAGRAEEAQRMLKQIVAGNPKRRGDILLLGDLAMRAGNFPEALTWLASAERLQPEARSELLLAISYQHLQQMDQANRYLQMAEHRAPDNPEVERSMAGYYRQTGDFGKAIAQLQKIKSPRPDVVAELAYTYQLDGKLDDAARLYTQAANAMPKDMNLQLSAAQAEIAAGAIEKTDQFLQRAATIDANYYRLHAIRAEIAKIQEHDDVAVKEYLAAVAALPKDAAEGPLYGIQLHVDLMQIYKELVDEAGAARELRTAQAQINDLGNQAPNRGAYLRLRSIINLSANDLDGALSDIKEALAMNSHDRDDLQLDGDILMRLNRADDAIAVYKQILAIDANNRGALTSLGYASRVVGHDQEAEKYFEKLAQVAPSFYVPYLALGDLYTARHDFAKAQGSYDKAYSLSPHRAMIQAGGLNAAIEAHNLDLAATWLDRVTPDMEKAEPRILREKERYLSFKGDYQGSADVAEQAIKVLPKDRDVVVYLGYDLLHLEKWDDLLALTTQYLDVFPKEPDIPLLQGYVHKHQDLSEEATADFTEALKRDPNVVTAYVNRGYTLNDLHKARAAQDDFEAAIKREPNNGEAHLGLAYSSLDLHKPQAALREADLTEKILGDSRDIHLIRATAYGRQEMLKKAADEYRAALKFTPDDGAIHLGLGNVIFAERHYHEAVAELLIAAKDAPDNADVSALLARSYANLGDRNQTLHYVEVAEQQATHPVAIKKSTLSTLSEVYVSTGEALSTLGDRDAAMIRFGKALTAPDSDRVSVRLAIAQLMAEQDRGEDAERQIALAQMEGEAGDAVPMSGVQFVAAADVFRSLHEYQLSQTYLERAKATGAPDASVRIGMANNYLGLGDTVRAQAELAAVSAEADSAPDYQYLLAKANVYRQQHHDVEALTSFAQASSAEGEDQTAQQALLQAGANEGLRLTPRVSVLSDFSVDPIFEDSTVYVLDSKLDASTGPVPPSDTLNLPPPRSSLQTQATEAFHLHLGNVPTVSGFFQIRNARGKISVPATNSIANRDTTDYSFNIGLNPSLRVGRNVATFNVGIQEIIRRDANQPAALNQNLFREFAYMSTSAFFNAVSVSGYVIHEAGPFSEIDEHSSALTGALDFRVGSPWGKTALVTGWGATDQKFTPNIYENYYTSSYIGVQRRFNERYSFRAIAEDIRAWRTVNTASSTTVGGTATTNSGIAQNLRPTGTFDWTPNKQWDVQASGAYSSTRSFHVYDAIQSGFAVTYARPFRRKFNDESGDVVLQYPIRFTGGMQEETFFNFKGGQTEQLRPYFRISLF